MLMTENSTTALPVPKWRNCLGFSFFREVKPVSPGMGYTLTGRGDVTSEYFYPVDVAQLDLICN